MTLFSKPVASIYVSELRKRLDPDMVPIFMPDTAVEVGDFGSFENGRFIRRGNVADHGLAATIQQVPASPFTFASDGKVTIGPSIQVHAPTGGDILKADVTFSGARAVLASFATGSVHSVHDSDLYSKQLMDLWQTGQLRADRVVVWSVKRATSGTVLVAQDTGSQVEVMADAAMLGGAGISLSSLSAGVTFGAERKAVWQMSSGTTPMTVWARLFKLSPDGAQVEDTFGYVDSDSLDLGRPGTPTAFTSEDLLTLL